MSSSNGPWAEDRDQAHELMRGAGAQVQGLWSSLQAYRSRRFQPAPQCNKNVKGTVGGGSGDEPGDRTRKESSSPSLNLLLLNGHVEDLKKRTASRIIP